MPIRPHPQMKHVKRRHLTLAQIEESPNPAARAIRRISRFALFFNALNLRRGNTQPIQPFPLYDAKVTFGMSRENRV